LGTVAEWHSQIGVSEEMSLTFDEAEHKYYFQGKPVPNVTGVLSPLTNYSMIAPSVLEIARQKGQATHKMVELDCKNELDEEGLPEWMQPVLLQWRKFQKETGFKMIASEAKVYHPVYRYAGTLDLYGRLYHSGDMAFIDVKRSFLAGACIGMQIAAYQAAYSWQDKNDSARDAKRFALRLNEKERYRMGEYTSKNDFQDFLTCLNFYRLKEICGK